MNKLLQWVNHLWRIFAGTFIGFICAELHACFHSAAPISSRASNCEVWLCWWWCQEPCKCSPSCIHKNSKWPYVEGGAAGGHDSSLATEKGDGHGHRPQSFLLCTRPSLGAHPQVIVTYWWWFKWRLDLLIKLCQLELHCINKLFFSCPPQNIILDPN